MWTDLAEQIVKLDQVDNLFEPKKRGRPPVSGGDEGWFATRSDINGRGRLSIPVGEPRYRRQNGCVRPGGGCDWLGGSMTSKILTLASEFRELRSKWQTLSIYEKFEELVVAVLTTVIALIIALATWQLLFHTLALVKSHLVNPADSQIFQGLFGIVLTVLIAMEFKHTLLVVIHHRRAVVQVRAVVSIALLSLVRRFIILDFYQITPSLIAALAGAALALGIVFWLVSNREEPQGVEAQEGFVEPGHLE
jgi:uncharacterized membrane protein (DUF373 family)